MLRRAFVLRVPRKKGKIPGFSSDTLTKVYRDAVHGRPADPTAAGAAGEATERPSSRMRYTPWENEREVTSHVGGIGVMSRLAYELRERDRAMQADRQAVDRDDGHDHGHDHGYDHEHSHGGSRHHAIKRGAGGQAASSPATAPPPSSSDALFGTNSGGASPMPDGVISSLAEYHARLHGTGAAPQQQQRQRAGRHSGVQLEILGLYRQMLREVGRMSDPETRKDLGAYIRSEYDKNVDLPRKHITKIEWCINTAKRKLEDLQRMSPSTKFSMR